MRSLSLRARMAAVFGVLITAVALFMIQFFPARMGEQAQESAEYRVRTVTNVMAAAIAPALEFDDPEYATKILSWLGSAPDARFALLVRDDGHRVAAWGADKVPARLPDAETAIEEGLLITRAPVSGRGGGQGTLYVGQSVDRLVATRDAARQTVVTASAIVLLIGLLACVLIATALVRPLDRLTATARDIARGAKPPRIGEISGGPEVVEMTTALGTMLDRLNDANHQLVEASRHAGMAEVATGVLHNVGNILTSVNVAIETLHERTAALPADRIKRASELFAGLRAPVDQNKLDAGSKYVGALAEALQADRGALLGDLQKLRDHISHVNRVITMQNSYARTGGVQEQVELAAMMTEAVALGCPDPARHGIEVVSNVDGGMLTIDRHRVLQILVNLLANARDSVTAHGRNGGTELRVSVTAKAADGWLEIAVVDTGGGIAPESLNRIFNAGFTTKPRGHGYGLHSSALAAEQLGGTLRCSSEGLGRGASFVLRVPAAKGTSDG